MNEAKVGGAPTGAAEGTNAAAQVKDPWSILTEIARDTVGEVKTSATEKAGAAVKKADAKVESADSFVSSVEEKRDLSQNKINEYDTKTADITKSKTEAESEKNYAKEVLTRAETEYKTVESENRFYKYAAKRTEQVAGIFWGATGAKVYSGIKGAVSKVVSKMPRIEIKSRKEETWEEHQAAEKAKWDNAQELARQTWEEHQAAEKEKWDKEAAAKLAPKESFLDKMINSWKETTENRKTGLQRKEQAKSKQNDAEKAYEKRAGVFKDLEKKLSDAKKDKETAEKDLKSANSQLSAAQEKAKQAKDKAVEKQLKLEHLQALAQFEKWLNGKPVKEVRRDVENRMAAYLDFVDSVDEGVINEAKKEAKLNTYKDQLAALDFYEEQTGKKKPAEVKPAEAAKPAEATAAEAAKAEEAPAAAEAAAEQPVAEAVKVEEAAEKPEAEAQKAEVTEQPVTDEKATKNEAAANDGKYIPPNGYEPTEEERRRREEELARRKGVPVPAAAGL
jgi:hypothetical protein